MQINKKKIYYSETIRIYSLLLAVVLLSSFTAWAQKGSGLMAEARKRVTDKTGVVVCNVSDENNRPLEYSTVAILNPNDSSIVSGTITNQGGFAVLDGIPWGNYLLRITYIGYEPIYLSDLSVSSDNPIANAGKQQIQTTANQLEGVVISAQREMIENNLDKRVFNVDKSILTEGLTGVDVLENIPSVTVDLDGNVSLRGSQSITILINGRPTDLTMDEIPANTIESIEVVTNPSARYEPNGTSGIINIVLKKDRKLGLKASLSLGAGLSNKKNDIYFGKYDASLNLNFRYDKVNFFLNYNYRSFSFNTEGEMERENIFGNLTTVLNQRLTMSSVGTPQGVRGGFDYFINQYNTLSVEGGYRYRSNQWNMDMEYISQNASHDTISFYEQQSITPPLGSNNWDAAVNYTRTSKVKGQELTIDLSTSQWNNENQNNVVKQYYFPSSYFYYQQSNTTSKSNRITAKLDFVTPIGNGGRLETGYKFNWNNSRNNYRLFSGSDENALAEDSSRNDISKYIETVNAVYLVYSNSVKTKFKYQLGLRAELANISSQLRSDPELFSPKPYFDLFPTLHLRYDFNQIHSLQLGYSIRIRRPGGRELNPFLDDADKLNLNQGNRKLKPEYTHSIDLGYLAVFKKTSLSANIFYRYKYDIISRYTILMNDSTTYTTYENLDNSHSYGLELSYQQDIFKFWKLNLNTSLYQTLINADTMYDPSLSNDVSWQLRLNNIFNLPKDFQVQLSANYRSPILTLNSRGFESGGAGQGRMSAIWGVDIGIRKSFFKKSLTVSLRASDIFYTRNARIESYGHTSYSSYNSIMYQFRDSRQLWLTVTYSLVNFKAKQRQQRDIESDYDDM
jgi:outer membrane receptor protein involved in Fe transport